MFAAAMIWGKVSQIIRLAMRPPMLYVVLLLAVIAAIYLYGERRYNQGSSDKEEEYKIILEQEKQRVARANERALDAANRTIEELRRTMEQNDDLLKDIDEEVGSKPDNGIAVDSVRRLNQIR